MALEACGLGLSLQIIARPTDSPLQALMPPNEQGATRAIVRPPSQLPLASHNGHHVHETHADQLLSLGISNGAEHVLDLATGHLHQRTPPAVRRLRRIPERLVSRERLEAVLRQAGIRSVRDADDDTLAHVHDTDVNILLATALKEVQFVSLFELGHFVPPHVVDAVVSELSRSTAIVRLRRIEDRTLCADYSMTYHRGLCPAQFVHMLASFSWAVRQALTSPQASQLLD